MLGEEPPLLAERVILLFLWVEGQGLEDAVLGESSRTCRTDGKRPVLLGCAVAPHGTFLGILSRTAFKLLPDELHPFFAAGRVRNAQLSAQDDDEDRGLSFLSCRAVS